MNAAKGIINWEIIGCGDVCEVKWGPDFNKVEHSKLVVVMRRGLYAPCSGFTKQACS